MVASFLLLGRERLRSPSQLLRGLLRLLFSPEPRLGGCGEEKTFPLRQVALALPLRPLRLLEGPGGRVSLEGNVAGVAPCAGANEPGLRVGACRLLQQPESLCGATLIKPGNGKVEKPHPLPEGVVRGRHLLPGRLRLAPLLAEDRYLPPAELRPQDSRSKRL